MKKIVFILCSLLLSVGVASAKGDNPKEEKKSRSRSSQPSRSPGLEGVEYHNFGFSSQRVTLDGTDVLPFVPILKGGGLTTGHSFYFHRRPIRDVVRFGFDINWIAADYVSWKGRVEGRKKWIHKFDMGMGIGPSLHLTPFRDLGIHVFFRFDPTVSFIAHNCAGDVDGKFELVAGFASYFSTGVAVSWSAFSIGGEFRFGGGKYRGVRIPDVTISREEIDLGLDDALNRQRHKMRGYRVYLSFRF